ncbi:MAG TPA: carboxylating nicotinate-nucleotide diphosphorylase [Deferrisomatales bacterium]|nr:carboxylating nicotinate-nucleotide diphosphorylase [Deferrisomatales bacterium]
MRTGQAQSGDTHGFPSRAAERVIAAALDEDVAGGDITTVATVPADAQATARLVAKQALRLAGLPAFRMVFAALGGADLRWEYSHQDGDTVEPGTEVLRVSGNARVLLTGERTALNLVQRLSGVATLTARWVGHLAGTSSRLVDTRKTTPGLRTLEKYAVRVGGAANHRTGLYDGVLIKENHIRAAGGIAAAVAAAVAAAPHTLRVQVEVTDLEELRQALDAGAGAVLLDNMSDDALCEAVRLTAGRAVLEASGGITEDRLGSVAATGVDLISAGALTHSAPAVDLSFLFET